MELESLLQELVEETPSALGSLILSEEGDTIAEYNRLRLTDLNLFAAEYSRLCREIKNIVSQLNMGKVSELAIKTDQLFLFAYYFGPHVVVLLTLPEARHGEAQFRLKNFGERISLELS
ncbi:roadblock/LC7 domain-containing protein [Bdellovibrionota bacterium]